MGGFLFNGLLGSREYMRIKQEVSLMDIMEIIFTCVEGGVCVWGGGGGVQLGCNVSK